MKNAAHAERRRSTPGRAPFRRLGVASVVALLLTVVPLVGLLVGAAPAGATTPCPCSLWTDATTPGTVDFGDTHAVEVGVQFSSATSGYLSGVRFYKAAANTGVHVGSLWATDGTLLAQATFAEETTSGWQQVTFATPVAVSAGTTYVASYHTNVGHYAADAGYFSSASYTNGSLTAPGGDPALPNGLFAYSSVPTFPSGTFNGNNYWVDVVYSPTAPAPTPTAGPRSLWGSHATPITVDSGDPLAVELGVQFSATKAGTLNGVRFYKSSANTGTHIGSLWASDGTLLAQATFSGESDSGWQQVTFATPVAIAANTTYVASYHTDSGHYAVDPSYFSFSSYSNNFLTAPGGDPTHPNGLYAYSPTPTFPTGTHNDNNYWVDVLYTPTPYPVSIAVAAPAPSLPAGTTEPATATVTLSDGSTQPVTSTATWTSSNPSVATVSATGVITAGAIGSATITATSSGLHADLPITVVLPRVTDITVTPLLVVLDPGQTKQLTATAKLADGTKINVTALAKWSTVLGTDGLTISATGVASATKPGAAIVSASLGGKTGLAVIARIFR